MQMDVPEFLVQNSALLVAVLALFISLRANFIAQRAHELNVRNKRDADRILLNEKKREALNELDRQHATLATLGFVVAQEVMVFQDCPKLNKFLPEELGRLQNNLAAVEKLKEAYEPQRRSIESVSDDGDIARLDVELAGIRRLTIHLEKDVAHERTLLDQLRHLASTAPPDPPSPEASGPCTR